ncbi:unnamed protein product, partial [Ixodes pacificus]
QPRHGTDGHRPGGGRVHARARGASSGGRPSGRVQAAPGPERLRPDQGAVRLYLRGSVRLQRPHRHAVFAEAICRLNGLMEDGRERPTEVQSAVMAAKRVAYRE